MKTKRMKKIKVTDCIGLELPENQNIRILSVKNPTYRCAYLKLKHKSSKPNKDT